MATVVALYISVLSFSPASNTCESLYLGVPDLTSSLQAQKEYKLISLQLNNLAK